MMNDALVTGIVSGLLTSILIFLSSEIFTKTILPKYREIIYKGVDLEGEWLGVIDYENNIMEYSMNLKQIGHQLSGVCIGTKTNKRENRIRATLSLKFEGYVRDGYVYGNFCSMDKKQVVFMITLLHITAAGKVLAGKLLYKEAYGNEKIFSTDLELKRKEYLPVNIT